MRELQERVLTRPLHLVSRFFGFVTARPLGPTEQQWVHDHLRTPVLRSLFFSQPPQDQRHACDVATRAGGGPDRIEAALLHDVGKSDTRLGAIARSMATVWGAVGRSGPPSWAQYRDHGERGARRLEAAGASHITVAFTRHHPGPVPAGIEPADWDALSSADDGRTAVSPEYPGHGVDGNTMPSG